MKKALLYERMSDSRVRCRLCAHRCLIEEGKRGLCGVRENQGGTLYTRVYGQAVQRNVDAVEKKPLFHFYPGSTTYSVGTPGCNFRCPWCQNWQLSRARRAPFARGGEPAQPADLVAAAHDAGCQSITYTYTEPTVFFEYALDTARLAHQTGLANLFVTNGYMTRDALRMIAPYLDAANVDLKAFRQETYQDLIGARLEPVLQCLKDLVRLGIWVEVTTLVIPDVNDTTVELSEMAKFISRELGADTPWHISRFFPACRMKDRLPTPVETLMRARDIASRVGLRYVYLGNVRGDQNTFCHHCGRVLIRRVGQWMVENNTLASRTGGRCPACGALFSGRLKTDVQPGSSLREGSQVPAETT